MSAYPTRKDVLPAGAPAPRGPEGEGVPVWNEPYRIGDDQIDGQDWLVFHILGMDKQTRVWVEGRKAQ